MEFIPLERHCKKSSKKKTIQENKPKRLKKKDVIEEKPPKKGRKKLQTKIIEKKVKSKRKESVAKHKVLEKVVKKKKKYEEEEEEEEDQEEINESTNEEKDEEHEDSKASKDEEEAFRKKCKEMDEKKKNRLFIKLKKKILNEMQIKELHPDIRSVIFPRKKNARWCWAVFGSQEKATNAMKDLIKKKDVFVNKPNPYDEVEKRRKEKMKTVLRKKQAKRKLQEIWT